MDDDQGTHREAEVLAIAAVSPNLVRIELDVTGPTRFTALDAPDEACVLHVPLPEGGHDPRGRWYSLRSVRDGRVVIEVVTHEGGVAAGWARRAALGDRVLLSVRNSWFRRPTDARWQILLGDLAALPAITRIVEETPADVATTVVVEIPDAADARDLPTAADVRWRVNPEQARRSDLEALARALTLPEGPGYVYVAGEAAVTRAVRRYLRHERGLPAGSYGVIGYWRRDAERWSARYEKSARQYERIWNHAERTGRDDEEILDIYEAELAEAGLL